MNLINFVFNVLIAGLISLLEVAATTNAIKYQYDTLPYLNIDVSKLETKYSPHNGLIFSTVAVNHVKTYVLSVQNILLEIIIYSWDNNYEGVTAIIRLKKPIISNSSQQCGSKTKSEILSILWNRVAQGISENMLFYFKIIIDKVIFIKANFYQSYFLS